jgi:hypothetical protein
MRAAPGSDPPGAANAGHAKIAVADEWVRPSGLGRRPGNALACFP